MKKLLIFSPLLFTFIFFCAKTPEEPTSYNLQLKYLGQYTSQTTIAGKLYLHGNLPGDIEVGTFLTQITGMDFQTGEIQANVTFNLDDGAITTTGAFLVNPQTGAISGSGTVSGGTNRYASASGTYGEQAQMLTTADVSGFITLSIQE